MIFLKLKLWTPHDDFSKAKALDSAGILESKALALGFFHTSVTPF
jgi:hypothetical protein